MTKLTKKKNVSKDMTFDEDDKLNRKSIAEKFSLLFNNTSQPFVVSLDSSWGTGKTQFIHMWRNLLGDKAKTIYINLWEEDFLQNPFFSLTEALSEEFERKKVGSSAKRKEFKRISWEIARAVAGKFLNLDLNGLVKENFNKTQRKNKEKFKKTLVELAERVKKTTGFPLLIFVDELDRCRPSYAVDFLEIAKHFFNTENVIFILGIDAEQLQHSVKSLYGEGMNAKEYLRKFIDFNYSFTEPLLNEYLDFLFSEFECGKRDNDQINIVKEIIRKFKPHLRAVDHLFTRLNLIEKNINLNYIQASFFLAFKIFKEKEYNVLINDQSSMKSILELMKYFESKSSNIGRITFWKIANDLILMNSNTARGYLNNLIELFSKLTSEWPGIQEILKEDEFRAPSSFNLDILKIFLEDNGLGKQPNITIVSNIFNQRNSCLKEFRELIQKIDFLEGLDFSGEEKNEN